MFKPLVWETEKENREKAIIDIGFGSFRVHIVYSAYWLDRKGQYFTLVTGPFGLLRQMGGSNTMEEAKAIAEQHYQESMVDIDKMINSLKVGADID